MAEKHEEEEVVIHQAPWVFFLTLAVCYGVLGMVMFGKWTAEVAEGGQILEVFGIQAGMLVAFLGVFSVLLMGIAALTKSRRHPEPLDDHH